MDRSSGHQHGVLHVYPSKELRVVPFGRQLTVIFRTLYKKVLLQAIANPGHSAAISSFSIKKLHPSEPDVMKTSVMPNIR